MGVQIFGLNLFAVSGILIGVSSFVMALFVLTRGFKKLHILWSIFCFCVMVWGVGAYFIATTTDPEIADLLWRLTHIGVIFIPITFTHVVYEFLQLRNRILMVTLYALGFFFLLTNFVGDLFIADMRWVFDQFYYDSPPGPLYIPFTMMFFCLIALAHFKLYRAYGRAEGRQREQIKYFFFGMIVSFAGGSLSFLPVYGINFYPIFNLTAFLYTIIVGYAIVHLRLFGIRFLITRGLALIGILFSLYFIAWLLLFLSGIFSAQGITLSILVAGVFAAGMLYAGMLRNVLHRFVKLVIPQEGFDFSKPDDTLGLVPTTETFFLVAEDVAAEFRRDPRVADAVMYVYLESESRWIAFHDKKWPELFADHVIPAVLQRGRKVILRQELGNDRRGPRKKFSTGELAELRRALERRNVGAVLPLHYEKKKLHGFVMVSFRNPWTFLKAEDVWMLRRRAAKISYFLTLVLRDYDLRRRAAEVSRMWELSKRKK